MRTSQVAERMCSTEPTTILAAGLASALVKRIQATAYFVLSD